MAVASAPGAAPTAPPATATTIKRQAVLLIHGMGEQQPMETIRGFATSVWQMDTSLHNRPDVPGRRAGELFYVPDSRSGSRELRRISTRKSKLRRSESGDGTEDSVRTDFFEIYWADATRDSTWSDFTNWYWRLLLRTPGEVPKGVLGIWIGLWLITLALVLLCATVVLWMVLPLEGYRWSTWAIALGGLALVATRALAAGATRSPNLWVASWLGGLGVALASISLVVLAADAIKSYLGGCVSSHLVLVTVLLALALLLAAALATFLVKFFGDVARYCLDTPGNIAARKEIRERGIDLVRKLTASGQYQRIVLVGHSLGTIVAYDILSLLWADYVSAQRKAQAPPECPDVPAGSVLEAALARCVAAARALTDQPTLAATGAFRATQRAVYKELRRGTHATASGQPPPADWQSFRPWLISDLVTIACPLTHAVFLLARNAADLTRRFERRELATCPPAMEPRNGAWQLVYKDGLGPDARIRIIHDAPFAAVRWTNIHDKPKGFFLIGDIISGPVNALFGRRAETAMNHGILDVKVAPAYDGRWLPARLFTHVRYWDWPIAPGLGAAPDPRQLDAVDVVRKAINLLDEPAAEAALITRAFA
jgi:hypothetical protein